MKKVVSIVFFLMFVSVSSFAQIDTLKLNREARSLLREGNELYKKEKYKDASIAYRKSLGKNAKYDKASYNFGNALYQDKNYKEAVSQYEVTAKSAKSKVEKAEAFHNIGNAMMEQKQYQQAVEAYKNALRNNPGDDETRYNLAVAQKHAKKEQKDNKQKNNNQKDKQNKNEDIKPSEYAKMMKQKADEALMKNNFKEALNLMKEALNKDNTTKHYQDYIKRLEDVNVIIK